MPRLSDSASEIAEMPPELAELLIRIAKPDRPQNSGAGRIALVRQHLSDGIPLYIKGGQEGELWRDACSLAYHGASEQQITEVLWEIMQQSEQGRRNEPWRKDHAEYKARRAIEFAGRVQ
jgi:hypothetical protein